MNQNDKPDFENNAVLVRETKKGNAFAEEAFVKKFGPGLWWVLRRVTRKEEDCEDLHQETLLRALEKIRTGQVKDPTKLPYYLASLARFTAIDYYRKRSKSNESLLNEEIDHAGFGDSNPLRGIIREENAMAIRTLLGELRSERDRIILTRFYIGEEDKELVCKSLGITALQFNRIIHRAKGRFREIIQKHHGDPFHPRDREHD